MRHKHYFITLTLCTAIMFSSCASSPSVSTDSDTPAGMPSQTDAAPTDAASASDNSEAAQTEEKETIAIGSKGKLNDWTFKVTKVKFTKKIPNGRYLYFKPGKGKKFLQVSMTVKNWGTSEGRVFPSFGYNTDVSAAVVYKDDKAFSPSRLIGSSKDLIDSSIKPSKSKKGMLVYEIPKKIASPKKPLLLKISAGEEALYFELH